MEERADVVNRVDAAEVAGVEAEVGEVVVDRPMREEGEAAAETTRRGIVPGRTRTRPDGGTTIGNGDTTRRWLVWEDRARLVIGVCNVNGMRTCTRLEFNDGAATDFQNTGAETSWNGSIDLD